MSMKAAVRENGFSVSKRPVRSVARVAIRKEKIARINLTPQPTPADPISCLGSTPIKSKLRNAAQKHDERIYDGV